MEEDFKLKLLSSWSKGLQSKRLYRKVMCLKSSLFVAFYVTVYLKFSLTTGAVIVYVDIVFA